MANSPLPPIKAALEEAYTARKTRLSTGAGSYPLWKPTDDIKDQSKANSTAGDLVGAALADGKKPDNLMPAYRRGNMLLALARDRAVFSRDRIARGGEYIKMIERELKYGLAARLPK